MVKSTRRSLKKRSMRKSSRPLYKKRSFDTAVKKVLLNTAEVKQNVYTAPPTTVGGPGILLNQQLNTTGDCLQLMPDISIGSNNYQKIGNKIQIKSLRLRAVLTFTQPQLTANNTRIGVRMMIIRAKRYDDYLAARTDFATNYTKLLEGTNTGFMGTVQHFITPPNTDYYSVVSDKKFYISQTLSSANTSNNDNINTTKFINMEVPYCKGRVCKYDENFDLDSPTQFPYFMIIGYCKLDGSAADAEGTTYLTLNYTTTCKYTDI